MTTTTMTARTGHFTIDQTVCATSPIPTPSLPRSLVGLQGPTGRAIGQNLPSSIAWGIGIGLFGLAIAGSGKSFIDELGKATDFVKLLNQVFPGFDIRSVGGFLQLLYVEFGMILAGLAAATLVAVWAGDETSGRLELLLATPLSRVRWVVSGGAAILIGIVVVTVVAAIGIAIGAVIAGGDIVQPVVGSLVLALYAAALAGIGVAIGGVFGSGYAAPAVAIITVLTNPQVDVSIHMQTARQLDTRASWIAAGVFLVAGALWLRPSRRRS